MPEESDPSINLFTFSFSTACIVLNIKTQGTSEPPWGKSEEYRLLYFPSLLQLQKDRTHFPAAFHSLTVPHHRQHPKCFDKYDILRPWLLQKTHGPLSNFHMYNKCGPCDVKRDAEYVAIGSDGCLDQSIS